MVDYDPEWDHGFEEPDLSPPFEGDDELDDDWGDDELDAMDFYNAWLMELEEAARYDLGWTVDQIREAGFDPEHWYEHGLEPDECVGEVSRSGKWPAA